VNDFIQVYRYPFDIQYSTFSISSGLLEVCYYTIIQPENQLNSQMVILGMGVWVRSSGSFGLGARCKNFSSNGIFPQLAGVFEPHTGQLRKYFI